jgi:hypothetical protein
MPNHVTYTWTQGSKSLGLPIRVTAKNGSGAQGLKEKRMEESVGKADKEEDKMMVIQEDQDGDIWSTS